MHEHPHQDQPHTYLPAAGPVPADFVRISRRLHPRLDRKLGYRGDQRYVLFSYVPEVEGVMWQDAFAHGFGLGAWCTYLEEIAPLAEEYEAELVGQEGRSRDAVVLDRLQHEAYLAPRENAEAFICGRWA